MNDQNQQQGGLFPRPPPIKTSADFVVVVFVVLVATMLMIFTIGIVVAGIKGEDIGPLFSVITDIMTTIIGALVGFIAGKSSGRIEYETEQRESQTGSTP